MSTKIYHGVKLDTVSLHDVLRIVDIFRPYVQTQGEKLMDRFFAKQDESVAWGAWIRCQKEIKTSGQRMPCCDTEFKLTIFPSFRSATYGIVWTEHEEWYDEFCSQGWVSEFGYWNNTDRPDHVSEEEWDMRRDIWNEILGDNVPAMAGFTIDVSHPDGPMPKALRMHGPGVLIKA